MYRFQSRFGAATYGTPRKQPAYRHHKARHCAVVTIDGKNHYLGPWQSPRSHEKYPRLIAEWSRSNGTRPGPAAAPLTINVLILAYFRHAQVRYVKYGEPTSEVGCIRQALRPLRRMYGTTHATDFGPKALKDVRQAMIDGGRARKSINKDAERIRRMFRWAVEEGCWRPTFTPAWGRSADWVRGRPPPARRKRWHRCPSNTSRRSCLTCPRRWRRWCGCNYTLLGSE